ncbi:hypothetical protein K501DRAFT_319618 [Backusella circina FSU 941]|nr:hypothetical protein K501DRAFT_319618 [Backusella circina FSU 941]
MSAEELESYQFQLEQVELALQSDPDNEELNKLQSDLRELIAMFEAALEATPQEPKPKKASPPKESKPVPAAPKTTTALKHHEFSVDQEVMARWSGDGQFYRATITAIGGADQVFSVKFKGYNEAEFVKAEDIKTLDKKRAGIFEDVEPKPKKKKENTTSSTATGTPKKKKASEFENKKNAWLNFATGTKKKTNSASINKKSIFKTPDNPEGKVGVVGSGRGMTTFQQRGKHVYDGDQPEEH